MSEEWVEGGGGEVRGGGDCISGGRRRGGWLEGTGVRAWGLGIWGERRGERGVGRDWFVYLAFEPNEESDAGESLHTQGITESGVSTHLEHTHTQQEHHLVPTTHVTETWHRTQR